MIASVAAIVFAVVTSAVVGFRLALALGAPWGAYAMGGRFPGKVPPLMRVAVVVQAVLLVLIVLIVLSRAGFVFPQWAGVSTWAVWVVVAVSAVALVLNTMTPSRDGAPHLGAGCRRDADLQPRRGAQYREIG